MPLSRPNRLKQPPIDSWPFQEELTFTKGLLGFEQYTRFCLLAHKKEKPYLRLIAGQNPSVSFVVIDPFLCYPDYTPSISTSDLKDVRVVFEAKLILLAIINPKERPFTMNLTAPLLIHWQKKQGKQILTPGDPCHPINSLY